MVPKLVLHAALASHKDVTSVHAKPGEKLVKSGGFNCDCNSLVVDLPFLYQSAEVACEPHLSGTSFYAFFSSPSGLELPYGLNGRGPPSMERSI